MPRTIRLKEFPKSTEISNVPPDWYVNAGDSSLTKQEYKATTDENGFVLPEPVNSKDCPRIIFLGDSVIEGMYARPENRVCSQIQNILKRESGVEVSVLNAGYSGATVLHSFNTFMNKIIPLRPAAVILMTGMVDYDVALVKASFWSRDCWIEPIVDLDQRNQWRDPDKRSEPSFDDQSRMLAMFSAASRIFDLPLWYATIPHRQVYHGEYVAKTFKDRVGFDREVSLRRGVNHATRQTAIREDMPLFDLESNLSDRADIFYDMFHLNAVGGEAVARSLIGCGFAERLQAAIREVQRHDKVT
ncbi:GDSL-like Lipase/Acylhydrolase family protein [Rhizobiales bacterium GAS188]|nr:GDSL-like Lipase/Acylhydrolase family protein [Rhizobiales bacterium GAS188]